MTVYSPIPSEDDDYELAHPVNDADWERFTVLINGKSRKEKWTPIEVKLVQEDENSKSLASADCPWLGSHALVLKPNAVKLLGPLLRDYGELLPLSCAANTLVVYNPTVVIDALDESAADISRFKDGRVMNIWRYAFRPEALSDIGIFKISTTRSSPTFFTDAAMKIWDKSNVTGVGFKQVWQSPNG